MRGLLARVALAAPFLATSALAAPPARADGASPRSPGAPLPSSPGAPLPQAPGTPLPRAPGARLPQAPGTPLPRAPGTPPPRAPGTPLPGAPGAPPAAALPLPPLSRAAAVDPWFGRDKALHFGASAALAAGGYTLGALATDDIYGRIALGAAVALGAGLAKEAFDAAGYGNPSWRDLAWDVLGTSAGLGLSVWFDLAAGPALF